jgi:uncharacterized protein YkwD
MLDSGHPFSETPIPGTEMSRGKEREGAAILSCLLLVGLGLLVPIQSPAARRSAQGSAAGIEDAVLDNLNLQRSNHGLKSLRRSSALDKAAAWQSNDMVDRGYFDHERRGGPSLQQRIRRTGYLSGARGWTLGENIALSEGDVSATGVVRAWMQSAVHREEILSRSYAHIGIGVEFGSPYGGGGRSDSITVTADFGVRR